MLHTHFYDVMFTKLVRVCLAIILLTALGDKVFKHKTTVTQNISRENITQCFIFSVAVRICSCSSYLLSFIVIFA